MASSKADLLPGTLDLLILAILSHEPLHGYGIVQRIKLRSEEVLRVGEGSLYPALQRMTARGWLEATWQRSETGRRARFYNLTPDGKQQVERSLEQYRRVTNAIDLVLTPV